jgi:hypothetical protein
MRDHVLVLRMIAIGSGNGGRRSALTRVAGLILMLASIAGCDELPSGQRLHDGPDAAQALEDQLRIDFAPVEPVFMPTDLSGQSFSYSASSPEADLLLVVFDRARDTRWVTGVPQHKAGDRTLVIKHANAVVFYTRRSGKPGDTPRVQRAIRQALSEG